ncbi:MAG: aminotransferase class I/II-fold pyridoxal phosphate-dependent enzyme [Actinomycetes bacterium]
MTEKNRETTAITTGRNGSRSLASDISTSTTWLSSGLDETHQEVVAGRRSQLYSRYTNPTVRQFECAIAELEGAEDALAFGSGMGALASVIFALCSPGDHIVAQQQLYAGTIALLNGPVRRMGINVTFVDATVPGAFTTAAKTPRTMLVIAETPANPALALADLSEIGAITIPFTVVDSTFATPMSQQPLAHGVNIALHSATKGIGGHNDALLGVIAGETELIDAIWAYSVLHGATASPYDAHNALRGIRTLPVRHERQCSSALELARWCEEQPNCAKVHYPGLASHPQHELATRQMTSFGSVFAIEISGGIESCRTFFSALQLVRPATSLGGPETLICHPATSTHFGLDEESMSGALASDGLMRISVGLEHVDDLRNDLAAAFAAKKPTQ